MAVRYDRLFVFDLKDLPDRALRLDREILEAARQGLSAALLPLSGDGGGPAVPTCLREHVAQGRAVLLGGRKAAAERVVAHGAAAALALAALLDRVEALALDVVLYGEASPPDLPAVPGDRPLRIIHVGGAQDEGPPVLPGGSLLDRLPRPAVPGVAWLTPPIAQVMRGLRGAAAEGGPDILDLSGSRYGRLDPASGRFADLGFGAIAAERLARRVDLFLCYPDRDALPAHDAMIRTCLAAGASLVLPPWTRPRYGPGPVYREEGRIGRAVRAHLAGFPTRDLQGGPARGGGPGARRDAAPPGAGRARRRRRRRSVLFLPTGGGLGHLSRSLAIARRLRPGIPVVVGTQHPVVDAVEALGFQPAYLPPADLTGSPAADWEAWFRDEIDRLIEVHDAGVVVLDGNHVLPALVEAVGQRRDCRLAWVRRGMWGRTDSRHMPNARWCDAILEPGEIAAERDMGVTASRRDEAIQLAPIRLLDPPDLLPRDEAAAALGLDPTRVSMVIQLGSGRTRDAVALIDRVVAALGRWPALQVCLAEGDAGDRPMRFWPEVKHLSAFPLARHYNAFDVSISAAGYNTFLDVISFGLPTIFIPNQHPSMDDQAARAKYAQDHAAAFELAATDMAELEKIVTLILNERARAYLRNNCLRLAPENGAAAAARVVERLLRADPA